jgi:N-methylhydantoinase B
MTAATHHSTLDPITLSVIDAGLQAAVAEMKAVVLRTAYSNLWREAGDLSCGLLDADGNIVVQGVGDIPIHLASMPMSLAGMLECIPRETLKPGDVLLQNDPYRGNNHMPDVFMAMPVFSDGLLIAFVAVRGHYVDIGGPTPGSYNTLARDIYGEGLRIPPIRLYREGKVNVEALDIITANVRNAPERMGDMRSQHAGCLAAQRRLLDYCQRYGTESVVQAMAQVLDISERRARSAFAEIPDGVYSFEDVCDGDSFDPTPLAIRATITVTGENVLVDFSGTSKQARGGMNSPLGVTHSATLFALKALAEPHSVANSGSYRPVTLIVPEGTVVNPTAPAPVVAGNHETSTRIADVVLGCLAQAVPERVPAASTGSAAVLMIARENDSDDTLMYEVHGAGQGGNHHSDGAHARRTSIGNTGNTPCELLEPAHPILIHAYRLTLDGGGAGRHRGGNGITRDIEFLEDATLTIVSDRDISQPYGLEGGQPGAHARFALTDPQGEQRLLSSKTAPRTIVVGSKLSFTCAGAGGYGNPDERPLASIQSDLDDGYITPDAAVGAYGIDVRERPDRVEGRWVASRADTSSILEGAAS